MKHAVKIIAGVVLVLCLFAGRVWPGGSDSGPEDIHDDGPSYFGFVRDNNGKIIPDAKVTAEIGPIANGDAPLRALIQPAAPHERERHAHHERR